MGGVIWYTIAHRLTKAFINVDRWKNAMQGRGFGGAVTGATFAGHGRRSSVFVGSFNDKLVIEDL